LLADFCLALMAIWARMVPPVADDFLPGLQHENDVRARTLTNVDPFDVFLKDCLTSALVGDLNVILLMFIRVRIDLATVIERDPNLFTG